MTSGAVLSDAVSWSFVLAPGVKLEPDDGGALLRTATDELQIEAADFELVKHLVSEDLANEGRTERELHERASATDPGGDATTRCAALLFRLDRAGLLKRSLCSGGRRLVSCVPLRAPPGPPPPSPSEGPLLLSAYAFARAEAGAVSLMAPGAWAAMILHDRDLLPLLHDLSVGRPASELQATGISEPAIRALIALMSWCDLLERGEKRWSAHDLLFHACTRTGFTRGLRGKIEAASLSAVQAAGKSAVAGGPSRSCRQIEASCSPPIHRMRSSPNSGAEFGSRERRLSPPRSCRSSCSARCTSATGGVPTRAGAPVIRCTPMSRYSDVLVLPAVSTPTIRRATSLAA